MQSKALQIRDALIAVIAAIQLDGEPAFTAVVGHPRGDFDSYPSVRVLPADQTSEKAAFGQNDRTVRFVVRTHLEATNGGTEFDHMYKLTDLLIDKLDTADQENAIEGEVGTYYLNTTRGDWFDEDSEAGPILSCDLNVEVQYSKDN